MATRSRVVYPGAVVVAVLCLAWASGCAAGGYARPLPPSDGEQGRSYSGLVVTTRTSIRRPTAAELPASSVYVFPDVVMPGFVLRSIGFRESLNRWITMDMTFAYSGSELIYEVQAFDVGHAVDLLARCDLVRTDRGQICAPYDGDNGRTTYRYDGDILVRVRGRTLSDADLARVRDSVRVVSRQFIADQLTSANGTSWMFTGAG